MKKLKTLILFDCKYLISLRLLSLSLSVDSLVYYKILVNYVLNLAYGIYNIFETVDLLVLLVFDVSGFSDFFLNVFL